MKRDHRGISRGGRALEPKDITNIPARRNAWELYRDQRRRELSDRIWSLVLTLSAVVIGGYLLIKIIEFRLHG